MVFFIIIRVDIIIGMHRLLQFNQFLEYISLSMYYNILYLSKHLTLTK